MSASRPQSQPPASPPTADIGVIGAGPAGLAAALALAHSSPDLDVRIFAPPFDAALAAADTRTAALIASSLDFLTNLGAWSHVPDTAAPLTGIRIIDDLGRILRAPEVLFGASDAGLSAFGVNLPNTDIVTALRAATGRLPNLAFIPTAAVTGLQAEPGRVLLSTAEGATHQVRLAVAADGRRSLARAAAGISVRTWDYPQTAIATRFAHTRPHGGISTEFHRPHGPLTTVPLPGPASSLVWVETPDTARRLCALTPDDFADALSERLQGLLGAISDVGPRATFDLAGLAADRMGARRIALVGEAAHVLPPIGAQGLNMSLRDAAALAECVAAARSAGADIGGDAVLDRYDAQRRLDVTARHTAVDLLNRSLLLDLLPVQVARGVGLHLLATIPALRRLAMESGLANAGPLPALMRRDGGRGHALPQET